MGMIDNLIAFRILYKLVTPFEKTDAFKLGIIDKDGTLLKKVDDLKGDERDAYDFLDRLVFNLKRLLGKLPGGKSKIASLAAAYFLVREHYENENEPSEYILTEQYNDLSDVFLIDEMLEVIEFVETMDQLIREEGEGGTANVTGAMVSTNEPVVLPSIPSTKLTQQRKRKKNTIDTKLKINLS